MFLFSIIRILSTENCKKREAKGEVSKLLEIQNHVAE